MGVAEVTTRISALEAEHITNPTQSRLELKVKELESKLELEQTTRGRMETQINRLKEAIEKLNHDCEGLRVKEAGAQDQARKLQRQLLELAEAETVTSKNDLKLALKRIEDLQTAING